MNKKKKEKWAKNDWKILCIAFGIICVVLFIVLVSVGISIERGKFIQENNIIPQEVCENVTIEKYGWYINENCMEGFNKIKEDMKIDYHKGELSKEKYNWLLAYSSILEPICDVYGTYYETEEQCNKVKETCEEVCETDYDDCQVWYQRNTNNEIVDAWKECAENCKQICRMEYEK